MNAEATRLKNYMRNNFDFSSLKKAGVFPKEVKFNDYEGQAKIICHIFDLDSIYDYLEIGRGTRIHISYAIDWSKDIPPHGIKFVETVGELRPVIGGKIKQATVIPFK